MLVTRLACRLRRFENRKELHAAFGSALDKTKARLGARAERNQVRLRPFCCRTVVLRLGAVRPKLDPAAPRCAPRRRPRGEQCVGKVRRLPDACGESAGVRLPRAPRACFMLTRGATGLAQIDAEPVAWHADFLMIAGIRKLTIIQELLDLCMGVPICD